MKRFVISLTVIFSLLALVTAALASGLPTATPEQVGLSGERLERIGKTLQTDVERGRISGAVVLVARKGKVAYFEAIGFRDKTAGAPMTRDAIFRIVPAAIGLDVSEDRMDSREQTSLPTTTYRAVLSQPDR